MAHIQTVHGRRWLLGLSWRSFEDAPTLDDLKFDAEQLETDWYVVRLRDAAIQAGFCQPVNGLSQPKQLYSLAALLADAREQPWIGTFQLNDDVWWYIAVRDGHAILPDGDVVGSYEDIMRARDNHSGFTDWNYLEGDVSALAELIGSLKKKPVKVKSFTKTGLSLGVKVILCLTLLLGLGGLYQWRHHVQMQEAHDRRIAMEKMRQALVKNDTTITQPQFDFLHKAIPSAWLKACEEVFVHTPISHFGWKLNGFSCNESQCELIWERQAGATVAYRPSGEVSSDGEHVVANQALNIRAESADNRDTLLPAKLKMRAWAQSIGATLTMNVTTSPLPNQALPGDGTTKTENVIPAQVPSQPIQVNLQVSPFHLAWDIIPGLRLTTLKLTETGWDIEGVIYGK
jgi:Pilin accessory protein (PilO)